MKFWQVDAFSEKIFSGNPAAVFVLDKDIDRNLKQKIAAEMNLSETAFVSGDMFNLKLEWFTPLCEVALCGHATIAAAHILWEQNYVNNDKISFNSLSGVIDVERHNGAYVMNFPQQPPLEKSDYESLVQDLIDETPIYVGINERDCMIVMNNSNRLESFIPDFNVISRFNESGLILTAKDRNEEFDYVYRAFFPKLNVPEDPVTGSANTILGPYWSKVLNKNELSALQISKRQGIVKIKLLNDRILIHGKAITVFNGEMINL